MHAYMYACIHKEIYWHKYLDVLTYMHTDKQRDSKTETPKDRQADSQTDR